MIILFAATAAKSQTYLGVNQSNYGGVNRMYIQPASIADSRISFDLGIGAHVGFFNNFLSLGSSDIPNLIQGDIDSTFLEENLDFRYNGDDKSAMLNIDLPVLSMMFSPSETSALSFGIRQRSMLNIDGFEEPITQLILSDFDFPEFFNQDITNGKAGVSTLTWMEYSAGFAKVAYDDGTNFIKAGGSLKFLQGMQSAYIYVDNFRYNFSNEDSITIFQSDVFYGHSESFNPAPDRFDFSSDAWSAALDLGVVYEWRPNNDDFKYDMDGYESIYRHDKNKYKLKVGLSLLDIGRLKFDKGGRSGDFTADINDWNIRELLSDTTFSIEELNDTLFTLFTEIPGDDNFKMNLPTAFNLEVDYAVNDWFFVNASGFFAFQFSKDKNAVHNFTNFSLTPRAELPNLGIYAPLSMSRYAGFRAGLGLRMGPVVIGTSDIRALFGGNRLYGASAYATVKLTINNKVPNDKDNDGVSDKQDKCPELAGVWEFRGCPDTDGDLIPDEKDECPVEAGLVEFNGCPDSDKDGIRDRDDDCPMVAGLESLQGCPDMDGDGIKDSEDLCPRIAGLAAFQGCPDTDNDGIQDVEDNCPTEAGPSSNFGCPEKVRVHLVDEDGNIVASASMSENGGFIFQNLPLDKTYLFLLDGVDEDIKDELSLIIRNADGDHDIIATLEESGFFVYRYLDEGETTSLSLLEEDDNVLIILESEQQDIVNKAFDNLQFSTGNAIIKKASYAALDELTKLLLDHPEWKILLEGHTDNTGNAANNLMLSKKRAEAVKYYLIAKGVSVENIIVKFYGQTKPIGDNTTEEGRQKNRRVEMSIVD